MTTIYQCMIATADTVVATRAKAASYGPDYDGMFTAPLSADGLPPATHYISAGNMDTGFAAFMNPTDGLEIFDHRTLNGLHNVEEDV